MKGLFEMLAILVSVQREILIDFRELVDIVLFLLEFSENLKSKSISILYLYYKCYVWYLDRLNIKFICK